MKRQIFEKDKLELSFGIGCFIFYTNNHDTLPSSFIKELKEFLDKQSNINNIKFDFVAGLETFHAGGLFSDDFPSPDHWYPAYTDGSIEFTLYLPEKNQKELHPLHIPTETENFHVFIGYSPSGLPVTFIKPISSKKKLSMLDAPEGVVVVREYLKNIFKDSKNIKFKCVGPSPAHLNSFVYSNDDLGSAIIKYEYHMTEGYSTMNIAINSKIIKKDKYESTILYFLLRPFSLYYLFKAERACVWHREDIFFNIYESLLEGVKKIKFRNFIKKYFVLPSLIQKSFLELMDYEVSNTKLKKSAERKIEEIKYFEEISRVIIAKEYITKELAEVHESIDTSIYHNTISFLEGRYQNHSALMIAMLSAIMGGVIGGAISFFLRW